MSSVQARSTKYCRSYYIVTGGGIFKMFEVQRGVVAGCLQSPRGVADRTENYGFVCWTHTINAWIR